MRLSVYSLPSLAIVATAENPLVIPVLLVASWLCSCAVISTAGGPPSGVSPR
jgi:hypothetical protein